MTLMLLIINNNNILNLKPTSKKIPYIFDHTFWSIEKTHDFCNYSFFMNLYNQDALKIVLENDGIYYHLYTKIITLPDSAKTLSEIYPIYYSSRLSPEELKKYN